MTLNVDSFEQIDKEIPDKQYVNFEDKVCGELNEMGIMDIQPDELMEWMSLGCAKDDGD
jgi:hypothetical protein